MCTTETKVQNQRRQVRVSLSHACVRASGGHYSLNCTLGFRRFLPCWVSVHVFSSFCGSFNMLAQPMASSKMFPYVPKNQLKKGNRAPRVRERKGATTSRGTGAGKGPTRQFSYEAALSASGTGRKRHVPHRERRTFQVAHPTRPPVAPVV